MDPTGRDALEREIRRCAAVPDPSAAATAAIRGYGPEVLRFLLAFHDEAGASEVFSLVAEGLWRGVGAFDWRCTFRTFAFGVARRASLRYRRDQGGKAMAQRSRPSAGMDALWATDTHCVRLTIPFRTRPCGAPGRAR